MLPIKLDIENFYCHSKSVIDFRDFSSAVIVGRINDNDKFSNGAGKSTIFAAIKYVLFNEVDTSSLEKIIKHDSDFCRVSFEFSPSIDGQVYKIVRFRGRKPGGEVRLFRSVNDGWDDLTQRTSTETDKEIIRLIKINYKTFSNSVLFAQGDASGIAAMTPRERKSVLKDALQLGVYSKYENSIKKKSAELTKDIEKAQTILSTMGDPESDILKFKGMASLIGPIKKEIELSIDGMDKDISEMMENVFTKQKLLKDLGEKILATAKASATVNEEISKLDNECKKYSAKVEELGAQEKNSFNKIKIISDEIERFNKANFRNEQDVRSDIYGVKNIISEKQTELNHLIIKYKDLSIPLANDSTCKHCRQTIDPSARDACQKAIDEEIETVKFQIEVLNVETDRLKRQVQGLEKEQDFITKSLASLKAKELELDREKRSVVAVSTLLIEFKGLKGSKENELNDKKTFKLSLIKDQNELPLKEREDKLVAEIDVLKNKLTSAIKEKKFHLDRLSEASNEEAVLCHKMDQRKKDLIEMALLGDSLKKLEYQFVLHQKVLTAFGPNGIPALITHTILDDYQIEANNMLDRLRPGLRLQFITENERSDGEMADALDITYFLNNTELEFSQLSGAQKLIVSLSLRLGLAAVIGNRLGVDLKMILIDEADQSLDEGALETFEQAIKELQKEYKILIITHNLDLKMKFGHAIVVEQDNKLNSIARVSNGW